MPTARGLVYAEACMRWELEPKEIANQYNNPAQVDITIK